MLTLYLDLDVHTPNLDGTILPGVTRSSVLSLLNAHSSSSLSFPTLPKTLKIHTYEHPITMADLKSWSDQGKLLEIFGVGTAVIVAGIGRIGYSGWGEEELVLPAHEGGLGPVGKGLFDTLTDIQVGKVEFKGWCVPVV